MFLTQWKFSKKGISIVEILVVITIIGVALGTLLNLAVFSLKSSSLTKEEVVAGILAQKTMEEVRSFRDGTGWDAGGLGSLTTGSAYHPATQITATSTIWTISSGEETAGIYTRKVVLHNVSRDLVTGNIESTYNPSNNDPDTRKVVATVFWGGKTMELVTYFTNWKQ